MLRRELMVGGAALVGAEIASACGLGVVMPEPQGKAEEALFKAYQDLEQAKTEVARAVKVNSQIARLLALPAFLGLSSSTQVVEGFQAAKEVSTIKGKVVSEDQAALIASVLHLTGVEDPQVVVEDKVFSYRDAPWRQYLDSKLSTCLYAIHLVLGETKPVIGFYGWFEARKDHGVDQNNILPLVMSAVIDGYSLTWRNFDNSRRDAPIGLPRAGKATFAASLNGNWAQVKQRFTEASQKGILDPEGEVVLAAVLGRFEAEDLSQMLSFGKKLFRTEQVEKAAKLTTLTAARKFLPGLSRSGQKPIPVEVLKKNMLVTHLAIDNYIRLM